MKTLDQMTSTGGRVLIRSDLNVPIRDGQVTSDARIAAFACLSTMRRRVDAGGRQVMLTWHLVVRPRVEFVDEFSLKPVAEKLTEFVGQPVKLVSD